MAQREGAQREVQQVIVEEAVALILAPVPVVVKGQTGSSTAFAEAKKVWEAALVPEAGQH